MRLLTASQQLREWERRATDTRPRVRTGWPSIDRLLYRGGLAPGDLALLAGRTRTRKTTVALNIVANLLQEGIHVGFVGLDEAPATYVAKLASVLSGASHEHLEENWWDPEVEEIRQRYYEVARRFTLSRGYRPTPEELTEWKEDAERVVGEPMRVVIIDYVSLLTRDRFAGPEVQRVQRLIEELQVWTAEQEVVTIALHQVGRFDEGTGGRYHGDTPLTLEGLKWGGEEVADVVFATYRPSLDPLGNMTWEQAQAWNPRLEREDWERARARVERLEHITYLQLLKNRPGTQVCEEGVPLVSPDVSMRMFEARPEDLEVLDEDMRPRRPLSNPEVQMEKLAFLLSLAEDIERRRKEEA